MMSFHPAEESFLTENLYSPSISYSLGGLIKIVYLLSTISPVLNVKLSSFAFTLRGSWPICSELVFRRFGYFLAETWLPISSITLNVINSWPLSSFPIPGVDPVTYLKPVFGSSGLGSIGVSPEVTFSFTIIVKYFTSNLLVSLFITSTSSPLRYTLFRCAP